MTKLEQESKAVLPRIGWVLYDGGCGFCFRWVHFWEKVIERRGFALKDLQSARDDGSLKIPQQKLMDDILVLSPDGELQSEAAAYLFVARRIWWAWPFYAIFRLPGFDWMLWQAIVGSIVTDTASLATAHYRSKPTLATCRRTIPNHLGTPSLLRNRTLSCLTPG
jgi:predicted DCC family thiol-disulfide oxidoreductase YuxK